MKELAVSERRSCALIGIPRSSYRYRAIERVDDGLGTKLHDIAEEDATAGYRTAWAHLRRGGHLINHKRVQRVWKEEGLNQPKKQTRKRHLGGAVPIEATHPNHVWTYDFIHDRTENGHSLRILTVEDEYTREGLAVVAGRNLPASRVKQVIELLILDRGAPEYLRSDGPEFIAVELIEWLMEQSVKTHHIDPGSPWQNAYGESFNAILRRECLNRELFHSVLAARIKTDRWRSRYNTKRPHSGLGFLTPEEFREGVTIPLLERGQPSTHRRRRERWKNRKQQVNKKSDLYLQVVQT